MSLIPSDKFDQQDSLDIDSIKAEVVRNERSVAGVSPINGSAPTRRSRAADRVIAAQPATQPSSQPSTRLSGSPLPAGNGAAKTGSAPRSNPLGRALATQAEPPEDTSAAQKALGTLKQALPLVQKLLPLLDGNIVAAVGNLLAPRPPAPQKLDLAPLESHMADLQLMHHDLRSTVTAQNSSLKRVEDQLEMVKEATDRNTLEQQEMMEDLRAMGSKFNLFAAILFGILIISLILNFLLFMHIKQVLP